MIRLLLYNGSILENYTLPIYKNSLNNLTISTYNSFNSLYNDKSIIEIKSNNNNANISIVSFNNTELDKIGNKLLWENVGGSYFKVNSERLSFVLNNTNNTFEVSSTSNFSYKPLYIPELIFADGTTMNTSAITMLNSENQLIMNNSESGYNYTDNQLLNIRALLKINEQKATTCNYFTFYEYGSLDAALGMVAASFFAL